MEKEKKEKKDKKEKTLKSMLKERVISRQVLKKNSMVVNVPNFVAPSILGDENRFFRGELNKEKRSLYFG
jgi:hypothetical protein